jgi:predicted RNA-binding protein
MKAKCYRNFEGEVIFSDDVLFIEKEEDIIDGMYIKDVWYREPSEIYAEILKENKLKKNNKKERK